MTHESSPSSLVGRQKLQKPPEPKSAGYCANALPPGWWYQPMLGGRERASSCSVCLQTDVDTQTERIDVFECNICLDSAQEPVVTFCGHLFCWPCIYRWLEVSAEPVCPVCKAPVSPRRLIPVYGRGKPHFDPRVSPLGGVAPADARIPNRPHSRRPDAHRRGLAAALQPEAHAELPTLGGTTSASLLPCARARASAGARSACARVVRRPMRRTRRAQGCRLSLRARARAVRPVARARRAQARMDKRRGAPRPGRPRPGLRPPFAVWLAAGALRRAKWRTGRAAGQGRWHVRCVRRGAACWPGFCTGRARRVGCVRASRARLHAARVLGVRRSPARARVHGALGRPPCHAARPPRRLSAACARRSLKSRARASSRPVRATAGQPSSCSTPSFRGCCCSSAPSSSFACFSSEPESG